MGYFAGLARPHAMMKSAVPKSPASFEAALQELEQLVQTLEGGGVPLDDALKTYERGVTLLKHCQETLARAEQRIRILDGEALTECSPADPGNGEGGAD
jgi:exodeoxyribonuclease VII small subunit